MSFNFSPKIVKDGLAFYVDAGNPKSYVSGATACYDLTKSYNGNINSGVTYQSSNSGVLNFNGTSGRILFDEIDFGSVWTFSVWVYFNDTQYNTVLVGWNNGSYIFYIGNSTQLFVRFSDLAYIICPINPDFSPNVWYNLTLVRNGSNLTWYKNGQLLANETGATAVNKIKSIGSYADSNFFLNGKISSVIGHKRALSESEVLQNYNALKSRFGY